MDEDFGGRRRAVEVVPDALREPDAALDGSALRAGLHLARLCPTDLLRADAALGAPRGVRIVAIPQLERIDAQLVRQNVHRLLEAKSALRVPGRAECRRGSGVQEDVGLLDVHDLGGIDVLHRSGAARARRATGAAERVEAQGGQLAVLARADAQPLQRAGAGREDAREVE